MTGYPFTERGRERGREGGREGQKEGEREEGERKEGREGGVCMREEVCRMQSCSVAVQEGFLPSANRFYMYVWGLNEAT